MPKRNQSKYITYEMEKYIESIYKGISRIEICRLVNEKFGTNINTINLNGLMQRRKWNTGYNPTRYQKGNTSPYKGKKWDDWMSKEGQERIRKSGNLFHSKYLKENEYHPIGALIFKHDTVMYKDEEGKWERYPKKVWEDAYGKLPDGKVILHIDGNKQNNNLDNLIPVTKADLARINQKKLTTDADINQLIIDTARIKTLISERTKNGKE